MSIHRFRTGGDTQARRSRLTLTGFCLFMSSSPSALFREHFYDVLSRLPDGFYKLSFFSDRHGGLIVVLIFCLNNVNNFHVIFLFSYLTFICRSPRLSISFAKAHIEWIIGLGLKSLLNSILVDSTTRLLTRSSIFTGIAMLITSILL